MALSQLEEKIQDLLGRNYLWFIRISLFVIYIWFGGLKLVGLSPAHDLAGDTMSFIPSDIFVPALAIFEVLLGISFLFPKLIRYVFPIFILHMFGTFLPLIILPEQVYNESFFELTLVGQYIVKNLALIGCATTLFINRKD